MDLLMKEIISYKEKLNMKIEENMSISTEDILVLSQHLDILIKKYYNKQIFKSLRT